jgi:hypothetical protein
VDGGGGDKYRVRVRGVWKDSLPTSIEEVWEGEGETRLRMAMDIHYPCARW